MLFAAIAAVSCVAFTYVVIRLTPFQRTTDALTKPDPFTVSVNAGPPAVALFGDSEVRTGTSPSPIVNMSAFDAPPPGAGLNTVTLAVPALAMSLAGIAAVACVALTYVVVRFDPFHLTTDVLTKPDPFTVSVNAGPPGAATLGDSVLSTGIGLLIVNVRAFDVPPPGAGLNTVTLAVPAFTMSLAGITAVTCVALTYVVVRFDPFQRTTDALTKPDPFTVSVPPAPPAIVLLGESEVRTGTGFPGAIVNTSAFDVPPPGAGLNTVTLAVPAAAMSLAGIAAVTCVVLKYVVVRLDPFQRTTDELTKPDPFTVSVNAGPPGVALLGESEVSAGMGLLIVSVRAFDVSPSSGSNTVTLAVPALAMSFAGITAVTCVVLTYVVVRFDPFQRTTMLPRKHDPFTVSVNAGPPAVTLLGNKEVRAGPVHCRMGMKNGSDVPPPGAGLETNTNASPETSISLARIPAVTSVGLTYVVVRGDMSQSTTDVLTKSAPYTVNVNAGPPERTALGYVSVTEGTGLLTVNVSAFDVPPPGAGLNTVTLAVPALAMSLAGIAAVTCVVLTYVVVRGDPFQRTTDELTRPDPFTVSANAGSPAITLLGDSDVRAGTG
jgi:hypothetical protein